MQSVEIQKTYNRIKNVVAETPLQYHEGLSEALQASIYLKREDLQIVRSYKLRGAYNFISQLSDEDRKKGVVCASAGNHAQGVAWSCLQLQVKGVIFMPKTTPKQKIRMTKKRGKEWVEVCLEGDTFDETAEFAKAFQEKKNAIFVHPFDDEQIIAGGGTVGLEISHQLNADPDIVVAPIGGGGLLAGLTTWFNGVSAKTKIVGVEPEGACSMHWAIEKGKPETLVELEKFVDGAAVAKVGERTFEIIQKANIILKSVAVGAVCSKIIQLYNEDAIVAEPAGAMSITVLEQLREEIAGKTVVCIVSGGNNDLDRMPEIKERALVYEGLKHYFLVQFPQRAGALREFLDEVLGPNDDITRFEYTKSHQKEGGPALVGIELLHAKDFEPLLERMRSKNISFKALQEDQQLYDFLV